MYSESKTEPVNNHVSQPYFSLHTFHWDTCGSPVINSFVFLSSFFTGIPVVAQS